MTISPLVSIVDDDASVREALPALLGQFGLFVRSFDSAESFLASPEAITQTRCLVVDIAMPGLSGIDLQDELTRRRVDIPIVFVTAHADPFIRARVMSRGARDCLSKPFSDADLLEAINKSLAR